MKIKQTLTKAFSILSVSILVFSCAKDEFVVPGNLNGVPVISPRDSAVGLPTVKTDSTFTIKDSIYTTGGYITADGGSPITARGVVWGTAPEPTLASANKTADGTGIGSFKSTIIVQPSPTIYYYRAYATNAHGTQYGFVDTFSITPKVEIKAPTVITDSTYKVQDTAYFLHGMVIDDGGSPVTARGMIWGSDPTLVTWYSKTEDGVGVGSFNSEVGTQQSAEWYYYRAYATNAKGTSYGAIHKVWLVRLPHVDFSTLTNITTTTVDIEGIILNNFGLDVLEQGFCLSATNQYPTKADAAIPSTESSTVVGSFKSTITGLAPNTTYYIRAYAVNAAGISYGMTITSFTTAQSAQTIGVPTIQILSISATQVRVQVLSDGGSPITTINATLMNLTKNFDLTSQKAGFSYRTGDIIAINDLILPLPGDVYKLRLKVMNEVGWSEYIYSTTVSR